LALRFPFCLLDGVSWDGSDGPSTLVLLFALLARLGAERLSPLDDVLSTATHFVLRT